MLETGNVTVQLSLAGMTAPVRAILVPLATRDTAAPPQVVAPVPATLNEAGRVSIRSDCVRANAFELFNVMVSVEAAFVPVVAGTNASVSVGAAGLNETALGHELLPAVDGAVLVALVDPTVTVATSVPPCESVTVRVNVPVPETVTWALPAPETIVRPVLVVHAYDWIVRLQAAALPLALNTTGLFAVYEAGKETAAIGSSAALTAFKAFAMPLPHSPEGGHEHSSVPVTEAGQTGKARVFVGKGLALDSSRVTSCFGVRFPLTARIRPAIPDTMGAEKLVPRLEFVSLV